VKAQSFLLLCGLLIAGAAGAACGGGTPPKGQNDAVEPFDDGTGGGGGAVQAASSAKVEEGMKAIQAKDFEKAKQVLTEAEAEAPKDPQAAFYLGVALENLGDAKGAREKYQKALSLDPKLSEASVNLSAILLDSGDEADAKAALDIVEAGLKSAPAHPGLLMNHALALEAVGDKARAVKAYAAAVKAQPDNLAARYAYAELLADAGKRDQALGELKKLGAIDDPKLLEAAANLFGKLQSFADCVGLLDKAIARQATPDLHTRRALCRHEMKDDAGAQKDFEAAVKIDPKFAPAHYYLGMSLKAAGKIKEAKAELEQASTLGGDQGVGQAAKKALEELAGGKAPPKKK
jgi:Flp pilus assembly protein TadD